MANEIEVGAILEGKVTGITKFGAFVSLPGGKSGLVHISEIAYSYVSDVNDHLSEGQDVKVKITDVDAENKRISLSIRALLEDNGEDAYLMVCQTMPEIDPDFCEEQEDAHAQE